MEKAAGISLMHEGSLQLASQVVLGTVDVAAVGARVLLALEPPEGWTVHEAAIDIRGLEASSSLRPVLAAAPEAGTRSEAESGGEAAGAPAQPGPATPPVVVLRNFYAPGASREGRSEGSPQISLLVVNAVVPEGEQAEVAAALVDLVASAQEAELEARTAAEGAGGQAPPSLTLVAAMLLQHLPRPAALYQHLINGAQPLDAALPPLTGGGGSGGSAPRLRDGQLAALVHVLEVSGVPACCLLAPANKPPAATPLELPASATACDALGGVLASGLGLRYDADKCRAIRATYRWFVPDTAAGSDVMYM